MSEIAGIPVDATPEPTASAPTETMAADLASLLETMETLQGQLKVGTHIGLQLRAGPKPIRVASMAADDASKSRGLRGGDILVVPLGLGIGAVITLVFF